MLGAATDRALPFLRAQAESRMKARCVIRRVFSQDVDPLTGQTVTTFEPAVVYSGKCRVKNKSSASEADAAGALVVVLSDEVHIPWDSCEFRVNDVIEIVEHRRVVEALKARLTPGTRTVSAMVDGIVVALCEMRAGKLEPSRVFHLEKSGD